MQSYDNLMELTVAAVDLLHTQSPPYFHVSFLHPTDGQPGYRVIPSDHSARVAAQLNITPENLFHLKMAQRIGRAMEKEFGARAVTLVDTMALSIWMQCAKEDLRRFKRSRTLDPVVVEPPNSKYKPFVDNQLPIKPPPQPFPTVDPDASVEATLDQLWQSPDPNWVELSREWPFYMK